MEIYESISMNASYSCLVRFFKARFKNLSKALWPIERKCFDYIQSNASPLPNTMGSKLTLLIGHSRPRHDFKLLL